MRFRPSLPLAALFALLLAPLPGPAEALLRLKIAPPEARLYLDGRPLATWPGPNGERLARARDGEALLLIEAEGYALEAIRLGVASPETRLEAKLERPSSLLRLSGMGSTGPRPKSVRFSPDGSFLVLPLLSGPGADILDARSLAFLGRLEPPPAYAKAEGFVESAILPALGEIWVTQMHTSRIHVFELESLRYKESFPSGGSYPKVIELSPAGDRAYVSHWVSGELSIFDTASRRLLATLRLGGTPRGLAASGDGRFLYVARFEDGAILRVELASLKTETFWKADGGAKRHLLLDPLRRRLYATDMHRGSLFAIDLNSGALLAELELGANPNTIAMSPDFHYLFASTRGPNNPANYELPGPLFGELVLVDLETLAVAERQWGGDQPTGLALSPDGRRLVFTDFLDARVEAYDFLGPWLPSPRPPR